MDTIFAVSSGRPPAAIAVIRVSGAAALAAAEALAGPLPAPRAAALRALRDGQGMLLDRALVLVFPGPASATGEDLVEFHCHGGRAVVAAVERALANRPSLRAAEPGEFTRRALINGRIDLAEAEGLADLLEAETETQRVAALAAAEGAISGAVNGWIGRITLLSAEVEAVLDFADEDDVEQSGDPLSTVRQAMVGLAGEIDDVLAAPPIERIKDGVRVVIAGPPNAGKSTLFNLLCDREAAIVSPIAGTTRDRVEASVQRKGTAYLLIDTAGLNPQAADMVEEEGIVRAEAAAASADVLVWLADTPPPRDDALWVHGRADLPDRMVLPEGKALAVAASDTVSIATLWDAIEETAAPLLYDTGGLPLHRHQRLSCSSAATSLRRPPADALLIAEHLRAARAALAQVTGAGATEAMLDVLFGRFCIGK
jgi:tRNA modification GTPase